MQYIPTIVNQFVDEIPFLYSQRQAAAISPNYTLIELAELDSRLVAHLQGLNLYGDVAWGFCRDNLEYDEPGEFFCAAYLTINLQNNEKLDEIIGLAGRKEVHLAAIVDAFNWQSKKVSLDVAKNLFNSKVSEKMYIALGIYADQQSIPDEIMKFALNSTDKLVNCRSIWIVSTLGLTQYLPQINKAIRNENNEVSFLATFCVGRFEKLDSLEILKSFLSHPTYGELALMMIVRCEDSTNIVDLLRKLYANKKTQRMAILGMGYFGQAKIIDVILDAMSNAENARCAAMSFSLITGLNIHDSKYEIENIENDSEDLTNELNSDEDLPWPDTEKLTLWWQDNRKRFKSEEIYLLGQYLTPEQLQYTLINGSQWQRKYAAITLGIQQKTKPVFNVVIQSDRQMALLRDVI